VTKDELEKSVDALEQEVIHELNLESSTGANPNRMFSVVFPYQVRFTIPSDGHNTEIVITTKTEEFYSGRNQQDVLFQKDREGWICPDGYRKTSNSCDRVRIPANAIPYREGWICPDGYRKTSNSCDRVPIPANAIPYREGWVCGAGYKRSAGNCKRPQRGHAVVMRCWVV
jgi:hypothetical protein